MARYYGQRIERQREIDRQEYWFWANHRSLGALQERLKRFLRDERDRWGQPVPAGVGMGPDSPEAIVEDRLRILSQINRRRVNLIRLGA